MLFIVMIYINLFLDSTACRAPPNPRNGAVRRIETSSGYIALYSCDDGYLLNGSPQRTCLENGMWSGPDRTCTSESG